jgi:predicted secreted protein
MERKHLEAPELRSQHILELHRTVADLRAQLRAREEAAALADHHREETGNIVCVSAVQLRAPRCYCEVVIGFCTGVVDAQSSREEVHRGREAQAQRVEAMLLSALLSRGPPPQR